MVRGLVDKALSFKCIFCSFNFVFVCVLSVCVRGQKRTLPSTMSQGLSLFLPLHSILQASWPGSFQPIFLCASHLTYRLLALQLWSPHLDLNVSAEVQI